jgi:hypothetical protein
LLIKGNKLFNAHLLSNNLHLALGQTTSHISGNWTTLKAGNGNEIQNENENGKGSSNNYVDPYTREVQFVQADGKL